jgi:hypothetical protein
MNNTQLSVKKHEGKIRLHIEWPVVGEDPDLMRKHDWDIPVVHALALAGAIVNEAVGLLRFPASPRSKAPTTRSEKADGVAGDAEHEGEKGTGEAKPAELGELAVSRKPVDQSARDGDEHGDQSNHADSVAPPAAES